ncbi:MAG TPA: Ig-like domain-containing protein, partial [Arenimonas sp.]|nr:Ig-like domain-containing protein [Arenimonas sp.]
SRCEGRAPFEVVSVKPEDGRANVLEDDPEILVELSEDVHPESLENPDLIVVRTLRRAPDGAPVLADDASAREATANAPLTPVPFALGDESTLEERVAGSVDLEEPNVLRFIPDAPLRPGVRYQIDIASGDDGIRSQEFHVLEQQWPTWFTTRVKPDEVRINVYQTTRDAPLIQRKPAMARVYLDWDEIPDIHPDWQVEEAEFDVRLTQDDPKRILVPAEDRWMQRPDRYDSEDKRLARDSVNLFGWKPRRAHGEEVVARVRPHDPYPAVKERDMPEDEGVRTVEFAASQLDELSVEPVIVRMGGWREEPPSGETIAHIMHAFALDNEYARQVFPVVKVRGWPLGYFEPPPVADWWDGLWWQADFLDDHYGQFSRADIVVGYYPPQIVDGRGQGIDDYPGQQSNVVLMPVRGTDWSPAPAIVAAPLVAHEYGHVFGLKHVPDVDAAGRKALCKSLPSYLQPTEGIEGFRILAGGHAGHSKSSTTGNGEEAPSLKQLMFPCLYDSRAMWWISDEYYKGLVKKLPGLIRGQRASRRIMLMTRADPRVQDAVQMDRNPPATPPGARWMMVSGFTDGARTDFFPAVGVPAPRAGPGPGTGYQLLLESEDGTVLASGPVRLRGENDKGYFSAALEVAGQPARVRLLKDGSPVGELPAGKAPQPPRILSHQDGALLETRDVLRWRAAPEGGAVRYSVRYHAGPQGPTRVLAALTNKTELALDPVSLPRGDAPTLEVLAHSGLHETSTRLRVRLPETLRPLLVHPVGEMGPADEAGIGAWFNADFAPDALADGMLRLLDAEGAPVPARAFVVPNGNGVRLLPEAPLDPGARYTVHLAPGLESADGRRVSSAVRWRFTAPAAGEAVEAPVSRQPSLPRAVTPLPPLPASDGDAATPAGTADRATGEMTLVGSTAKPYPVTFSACQPARNPSARVLLAGSFGEGGTGGRFQLERIAGDSLALSLELDAGTGPVSTRLQGSLERPGENGLVLREQEGHWSLSTLLDLGDRKVPFFLTADCGLR